MVTLEDISIELTKPIKHLAEWDYPFSETLETYYSLFNDTSNKGFSNAGLVLQNSTAVYVHRIDCLWNKATLIRNIFFNYEKEAEKKKLNKKRDKNVDINFENFRIMNFYEEIDKNIDIKKSNITPEGVKKAHCFPQLEKGIAQHIPIDIYDVNGEIIGKKYDFRCNQDISTNGVLIDQFAPEDFDCSNDDFMQEKSTSVSLHSNESVEHSSNTTAHESSDRNITSDEDSERNDSLGETSYLTESPGSSKNLSSSTNSIADALHSSTADNLQDYLQNSTDAANENQCTSQTDANLPSNIVESSTLSNNNTDIQSLNNSIGTNTHDNNDQLDGTTESIISQEGTSSMDISISSQGANEDAELSQTLQTICTIQKDWNACLKCIREYNPLQYDHVTMATSDLLGFRLNSVESADSAIGDMTADDTTADDTTADDTTAEDTYESVILTSTRTEKMVGLYNPPIISSPMSSSSSSRCTTQPRRKLTPKTPKKGRVGKKFLRRGRAVKNLLNELQKDNLERILEESLFSETDRISMFHQNLNTCIKYIQEYDPLQYDDMTDASSNFLGYRLRVVNSVYDDAKDDVITEYDDMLRLNYSPRAPCSPASSQDEASSGLWLRPDSPYLLPKNIETWHELLQPKLYEAERRSKFSIRDYTSRVIECLQANTQHQINFDNVIPKDSASEVARYFLASLELASRQKVNLIKNVDSEQSIQIVLHEEDAQYPHNSQTDSHN